MNLAEVMDFLEKNGSEQIRKIFINHGAEGDLFGVKIGDMKPIQKTEKHKQSLALELFATRNSDAQYLAGLIADPKQFSETDFETWAKTATWHMISDYSVAWNLAENHNCMSICAKWIDDPDTKFQQTAWAAMGAYLGITPNEQIDIAYHESLIERIERTIHAAENRVKYGMNGYIIALGASIPELTERCKNAGATIGKVDVFMGATSCKVQDIVSYISKIEAAGKIGKKKKTAKC